jgi:hypothetical protein
MPLLESLQLPQNQAAAAAAETSFSKGLLRE